MWTTPEPDPVGSAQKSAGPPITFVQVETPGRTPQIANAESDDVLRDGGAEPRLRRMIDKSVG
jgi:hypothetical protein